MKITIEFKWQIMGLGLMLIFIPLLLTLTESSLPKEHGLYNSIPEYNFVRYLTITFIVVVLTAILVESLLEKTK